MNHFREMKIWKIKPMKIQFMIISIKTYVEILIYKIK